MATKAQGRRHAKNVKKYEARKLITLRNKARKAKKYAKKRMRLSNPERVERVESNRITRYIKSRVIRGKSVAGYYSPSPALASCGELLSEPC